MINIQNRSQCNGCMSCVQKCPQNAILTEIDDEGFWYPIVNIDLCTNCNMCVKVCSEISSMPVSSQSDVYAAYCSNTEKRMKSASGGIFALLAEQVIKDKGVVFGAAFDNEWNLRHCYTENLMGLEKFKGSKYIQSNIGRSYREAELFLKEGRLVLFSGTPCQIQGLKKYLMKDYANLITVDLFCHGVPSPAVWADYLKMISKKRKLVYFLQRDKTNGVSKAPLIFKFDNGKVRKEKYTKNLFIRGFINDLFLRPSCYDCTFKGIDRCSDITLGDFWGIEKAIPGFSDDYGVSAVVLHTKKGTDIFSQVSDELRCHRSTPSDVIKENPCVVKSVKHTYKRQEFFSLWKCVGFKKAIKKLTKINYKRQINEVYHKLRHILWVLIKNKKK